MRMVWSSQSRSEQHNDLSCCPDSCQLGVIVVMSGEKQSIPILMYHSISNYASPRFRPCVVSPQMFGEHMNFLEQQHYTAVTVSQFVQAMMHRGEGLPSRPVLVTFDDGYADFYTHVFPVLQRHGLTATLYVATAFIGSTSGWLQDIGEGTRPMLRWEQLTEMSESGIECAAHSHTHRPLDMLPSSQIRDEVVRSKNLLEDHLSLHVSSFAYPFGYYTTRVRHIVQEAGFASACAIGRALSSLDDDPYALARLTIWPDTGIQALDAALSSGCGPLVASSIKRARGDVRRQVRGIYGTLWGGWSALYQIKEAKLK